MVIEPVLALRVNEMNIFEIITLTQNINTVMNSNEFHVLTLCGRQI